MPRRTSVRLSIRFSVMLATRNAGYAKWCASATAATKDLNNAPGGPSSKSAKHWVKGCDTYAASVGLAATASHAPAPPAATTSPATQPPPPTQAPQQPAPATPAPTPSSPQTGSSCTTIAGMFPGGLPGHIISDGTANGFCQPNGVPPEQPAPQTSAPTVPPGMYAWPGGGYCNIPFDEQYYQQNGVPGVCQPAGSKLPGSP